MMRWLLSALALPCLASAQSVGGSIVEQTSRRPIPGAVVFLVAADNAIVARDLTTETGEYRLVAPRAGTYRVRTLRIGFRPVLSDALQLRDGQNVSLPLVVESVPVSLGTIQVERRAHCPARGNVTQAYSAWNEVTTALHAALLSSRHRGLQTTVMSYDRWTDADNDVVLRQGANVREGANGQPWRSVPADSLHRAGFVVKDRDGWYSFYAPDLDVLLSDTFLADHCLQLQRAESGLRAIEFTPSRERSRIAEVRGFAWLDSATLELRRLQYRYVNVEPHYELANAGGELEFLRLQNGAWVISRWHIRIPTTFARGDRRGSRLPPPLRATEIKTTGGELLRVTRNGDTLWALPPQSFRGTVLDSASGQPVPQARVVLVGTSAAATTDTLGRFRMGDILPGAYTVRVYTAAFDSIAAFHESALTLADRFMNPELRIPTPARLLEQWCPALRSSDPGASGIPGMLFGVISAHDGTPVENGNVSVEWTERDSSGAAAMQAGRSRTAVTDSRGVYRLCGVPTDRRILFQTAFDGNLSPTPVRVESGVRARRFDVRLDTNRRRVDTAQMGRASVAQRLVPVEVSAERPVIPEFEARRAAGIGHFITRADLDKAKQQRMGEVIARVPGARVWRARNGSSAWLAVGRGAGGQRMPAGDQADQRRGAGQACYADVWLDNANVYSYRIGAPLFDLNSIPPQQIEAVEVYASSATIPLRYARGASPQCGVLIIWTRR